jgi:N-acetylated-alpha-linked acidic dipeptidase
MRSAAGVAALVLAGASCGAPWRGGAVPFGFSESSAREQLAWERRFLSQPDPERLRQAHRELTRRPHPAGSPRDRELAAWTARAFSDAGMEDVRILTHDVMLPRPLEISVEVIGPHPWRLSMREEPIADPDTQIDVTAEAMPFHAYSASGDVTAPVVYAGDGEPADYEALRTKGVTVRGTIVLVRSADPSRYVYRGHKALLAQQQGAAGILMFPADTPEERAFVKPYPDGRGRPDSAIERGSIAYDFLVPGDPLTPGWASLPGARRIAPAEARSLPRIVSAPISTGDARRILEAAQAVAVPSATPVSFSHLYSGAVATARLRVRMDDSVRPIWTTTGVFRGSAAPEEVVILGNHRDAWVYGGVDPSSGSAALLELARVFGELARQGWRPRRSILFASWDAEELALTSSVEWVEQHEAWLSDRAVAYINVDSAVSGTRFVTGAVPSLSRLIREVADAVVDPATGASLGTLLRDRVTAERGLTGPPGDHETIDERLGGGSDYIPFLDFAGVPVADLAFEGPFDVYHSLYDTHQWMTQFGDRDFRYHAALVRLWGLAALRLGQADVLPIDPAFAVARLGAYVQEAADRFPALERAEGFAGLTDALGRLQAAGADYSSRRDAALASRDAKAMAVLNQQVRLFERAFIDRNGLEERPWYRHLVHAPDERYQPVMLPGLAAALQRQDPGRTAREVKRLVSAFNRAAARLGRAVE